MKLRIPKWIRAMPGYKEDVRWMGLMVHKQFFDIGYGTTSPLKIVVVLLGGADIIATGGNATKSLIGGFFYALFCYFFGRYWCKWKIHVADMETNNIFNPFVGDVRNSKLFKDMRPKKTVTR